MIKKYWQQALNLGFSLTARNLYWVFTGNAASIVLAFFSTLLIARALTQAEFGIYLALFIFANLLAELGEGGLGAALSSFIPRLNIEKKDTTIVNLTTTVFYIELGVGLFLFAASGATAAFLSRILFAGTSVVNVWVSILMMAALMLFNFAVYILISHQKFKESSTINIFYGIVRLLFLFLLVVFAKLSLTWVLVVYMAAPIAGWLYAFIHTGTRFYRGTFDRGMAKDLFKFSGFLTLQKLFVSLSSRLDVLMLVPLSSAYEAGVYGAASRIAQVYPFIVSSFAQVLAPKFAEFESTRSVGSFFRKVLLAVVILLGSLGIFYASSPILIPMLFGNKYSEAIPVFRALLISMIGFIAATPLTTFIIYTLKKTYYTAIFSGVQLIIIFVANVILIPTYGRYGPIIGIGVGNIVVFLLALGVTVYYFRKKA